MTATETIPHVKALIERWRQRADDCDRMYLRPQAQLLRMCADELERALGVDGGHDKPSGAAVPSKP